MSKLLVSDLDLKGKKVLIRVDFNVPIVADQITDDNRIKQLYRRLNILTKVKATCFLYVES